jgi:hypothetical protein
MHDIATRFFGDLAGRIDGPMKIRFILQPIMAIAFAVRDGRRDCLQRRVPYFWSLFSEPSQRGALIKDGWSGIYKVFTVALILDIVYQLVFLRGLYPVESLVVAFVLAVVPYVLLRGPANRLITRRLPRVI